MKAIDHPEANVTLVLPGGTERNDLSAQRFMAYDPDLGETEADAHPAIESHWQPDHDERARICAGAPIVLNVHGSQHPPVGMGVAKIDAPPIVLEHGHVFRALGLLYAEIDAQLAKATAGSVDVIAGELLPQPDDFIGMFEKALDETKTPPGDGATIDEITSESIEAGTITGGPLPPIGDLKIGQLVAILKNDVDNFEPAGRYVVPAALEELQRRAAAGDPDAKRAVDDAIGKIDEGLEGA